VHSSKQARRDRLTSSQTYILILEAVAGFIVQLQRRDDVTFTLFSKVNAEWRSPIFDFLALRINRAFQIEQKLNPRSPSA